MYIVRQKVKHWVPDTLSHGNKLTSSPAKGREQQVLGSGPEKADRAVRANGNETAAQRQVKVLLSRTRDSDELKRSCIVLIASTQKFVGFSSEEVFSLKKKTLTKNR